MTAPARDTAGRQVWLDYAKGIGIALVVLGHANRSIGRTAGLDWPSPLQTLDHLIYSFHMPLFFVLAGYASGLSASRDVRGLARGLWWGIVVPYIIWTVIWVGLKNAAPGATNNPVGFEALLSIWHTPVEHMWFLYNLFIARAVWFVVEQFRNVSLAKALVVLAAFAAFVMRYSGPEWDAAAGMLESVAYFGGGMFIFPRLLEAFDMRGALAAAAFFAAWSFILLLGYAAPTPDEVRPFAAILGCAAAIAFARSLPAPTTPLLKWTAIAGEASMVIYLLHLLFGVVTRVALVKTGLLSEPALLISATLTGLVGPIVVYILAIRANAHAGLPLSRWIGFGQSTRSSYLDKPLVSATAS